MTMNEMESAIYELQQQVAALQAAPPSTRRESEGVRITKALDNIGVPAHLKGYTMLIHAISIAMNSADTLRFTKDVYPRIAVMMDTTPVRVERAMRHAVEFAFENGDESILHDIFGNSISLQKGKATNSQFVMTVAKKLSCR